MENKKPTQCERIIRYLQVYGTITSAEAMNELGVYRLASRISELKRDGYAISKKMVAKKNRWDETVHFAEYTLETCDIAV